MEMKEYTANWANHPRLLYGWAGELSINLPFQREIDSYNERVMWIHENVYRPYSNVRWVNIGSTMMIQFRKKKDMTLFTLRWT